MDAETIKKDLEAKIIPHITRGTDIPEKEKALFKDYLKQEHKLDDEMAEDIMEYKLFIKEMPDTIGEGLNQIVISLNEEVVVKLNKIKKINIYTNVDNHSGYSKANYSILKNLGFPVPESTFLDLNEGTLKVTESKMLGTFFVLSKNLKNSKYEVNDFDYDFLETIENKEQLKEEFIQYKRILQDMINHKHPEYKLGFNSHVSKEGNNEEAIRHVFLIQKNKETGMGKLYAGDFNHLSFYRNH